jgi:hypothetical protein
MGFELCSGVSYPEIEPAWIKAKARATAKAPQTSSGSFYRRQKARQEAQMKLLRSGNPFRHAHHAHHVGREGSHVMLPLVVISVMAIGLYFGVRDIDFSELGKSALFDVVMLCVALGIAGLFGVVGAWVRSSGDDAEEGFCFIGALIGAVVFYVALLR